jgi:hypothetical protein
MVRMRNVVLSPKEHLSLPNKRRKDGVITYCGFALQFKGHPVPNTVTMH